MSVNVNEIQLIDARTKKKVDACVRSTVASLEEEAVTARETPNAVFQRMLKMFVSLKPLFVFLSTFSVVPKAWRGMFAVFVQLLETLQTFGPSVVLQFKAGKDLEPAV